MKLRLTLLAGLILTVTGASAVGLPEESVDNTKSQQMALEIEKMRLQLEMMKMQEQEAQAPTVAQAPAVKPVKPTKPAEPTEGTAFDPNYWPLTTDKTTDLLFKRPRLLNNKLAANEIKGALLITKDDFLNLNKDTRKAITEFVGVIFNGQVIYLDSKGNLTDRILISYPELRSRLTQMASKGDKAGIAFMVGSYKISDALAMNTLWGSKSSRGDIISCFNVSGEQAAHSGSLFDEDGTVHEYHYSPCKTKIAGKNPTDPLHTKTRLTLGAALKEQGVVTRSCTKTQGNVITVYDLQQAMGGGDYTGFKFDVAKGSSSDGDINDKGFNGKLSLQPLYGECGHEKINSPSLVK